MLSNAVCLGHCTAVPTPCGGKERYFQYACHVIQSHEQIVSRQKQNVKHMASLRASETHVQTSQKQADSRKHMATLRTSVRRSVSVNSVICTFHSVVKPKFCAPVVSSHDVLKECCSVQ